MSSAASFLLPYRNGSTRIHRLDPRTKTISFVMIALTAILPDVRRWPIMAGVFALLILVAWLAQIPLKAITARLLIILPFALMVLCTLPWLPEGPSGSITFGSWLIPHRGLYILVNISVKSSLAVLAMSLLVMTTRFPDILAGLVKMRVPKVLIILISFMYRYLFVLTEEAHRMMVARDARMVGTLPLQERAKVSGAMAASLFLRTYERAERISYAMLARGFDGEIRTLNMLRYSAHDAGFAAFILAYLGAVLWWGGHISIGSLP